jgi:hypothetical protein
MSTLRKLSRSPCVAVRRFFFFLRKFSFLTQRRKDAKRCRVSEGFSLHLCAFA